MGCWVVRWDDFQALPIAGLCIVVSPEQHRAKDRGRRRPLEYRSEIAGYDV